MMVAESTIAENRIWLPIFAEEGYEAHVSAYAECERAETVVQLRKGAIVASLDRRYGTGAIEKMADDVVEVAQTLRDYARVYRRLEDLPGEWCEKILTFVYEGPLKYSHIRRACPIEDDEEFVRVLTNAHDREETVADVGNAVAVQRGLQAPPQTAEPVPQQEGWVEDEHEEVVEGEVVGETEASDYPMAGEVLVEITIMRPGQPHYGGTISFKLPQEAKSNAEAIRYVAAELERQTENLVT